MPEDVTRETAATSEPPGGSRGRLRLASQEFFFLLQRIDRLDEKLTGEIKTNAGELKALEERVNARIDRLDEKLSGEIKAQGERIDRLDEKLSGEIKTLDGKITSLNEKISNKFNNLTLWTVGILVTVVIGFLALLFR
ncbi:MAG TPA: hypothetical protein GXX19_09190 [Syntrophomonadaceae bacterium]|nr:hypothetical protein [Syntrophomonadaceae bacterium]